MDEETKELFALARKRTMTKQKAKPFTVRSEAKLHHEMRGTKNAKVIEDAFNMDVPNRYYKMGFKAGAKSILKNILVHDCPVKYWNGTEGKAVPIELIKQKLEELK